MHECNYIYESRRAMTLYGGTERMTLSEFYVGLCSRDNL